MNFLSELERAKLLCTIVSKDRSRDMKLFSNMGRTLVNIFDGSHEGLEIWKSVCVEEMYSLCDEYWSFFNSDRVGTNCYTTVQQLLKFWPDSVKQDIDSVKNELLKLSKINDQAYKEINKLHLNDCNNFDILMEKKLNISVFKKYRMHYNLGTLERWASLDNPTGYLGLISDAKYISENIFDIKFGTRIWENVYHNILTNDPDIKSLSDIIVLLRSSIGFVFKNSGTFIIKNIQGISYAPEKSFLSSCSKLRIKVLNGTTLSDIIEKFKHYIYYNDIHYKPFISDPDVLNLFSGYQAVETVNVDMSIIDIICNHIKDVLCNGNIEIYNYLLDWLSYIIQSPYKPEIAIVMIGKQGIGKTVFWEWFTNHIIGMSNSFIASSLSDVTGRFTNQIANKRFILINECKSGYKHDHEYLKTMITDNFIRMERKGYDMVQINSSHCVVITSNSFDHEYINNDDRRFFVIKCSDIKNDRSYFTNLVTTLMKDPNVFFTWLKQRDISKFIPSIIPKSDIQDEIKENNKNSVQLFLQTHFYQDWTQGLLVYNEYKAWCSINGYEPVLQNRFKTNANDIIETKRATSGIMYKSKYL